MLLTIQCSIAQPLDSAGKNRLIVTTDLGGTDPDDVQSMIHLLVCSNVFDLEGLISSQVWMTDPDKTDSIRKVVENFGEVLPRLKKHAEGYPDLAYLRSIIKRGQVVSNMDGVGEGKDSPEVDFEGGSDGGLALWSRAVRRTEKNSFPDAGADRIPAGRVRSPGTENGKLDQCLPARFQEFDAGETAVPGGEGGGSFLYGSSLPGVGVARSADDSYGGERTADDPSAPPRRNPDAAGERRSERRTNPVRV